MAGLRIFVSCNFVSRSKCRSGSRDSKKRDPDPKSGTPKKVDPMRIRIQNPHQRSNQLYGFKTPAELKAPVMGEFVKQITKREASITFFGTVPQH